jgi:hypothetical protein
VSRRRGVTAAVVAPGTRERGQGLVEFALVVPVFMLLLLGMLEFGIAFNHQLTLGYATREGARIGADLVNGGGKLGCGSGLSPNAAGVDKVIIEAVDRVLTSSGSPIPLDQVGRVRIFLATSTGADSGTGNNWDYSATGYTLPDGTKINFTLASGNWDPCNRSNLPIGNGPPASIGVSITYTYNGVTPVVSSLPMRDVTVMQFNPTSVSS